MKKILVLMVMSIVLVGLAQAAAFVKFGDIKGESKDENHEGWSDLESFSHAMESSSPSTAQRTRGTTTIGDITVTKEVDKSTPKLQEAIAKGTNFKEVYIDFLSSSDARMPQPYYMYKLTNARVTSYSISGEAEDRPTEEIAISFEEMEVVYNEMDSEGGIKDVVKFMWNLLKGTKA